MATVYALIVYGGKPVRSAAADATTGRMTALNHGLADGSSVAFCTGTLMTGATVNGGAVTLLVNTAYYAKYYNANEFELYTDSALTNRILWTGNGSSLTMAGFQAGRLVTFTNTGDIVNYANHGLIDGTAIRFYGATLPDFSVSQSTYYTKSTGSGTFTIYTTSALTTQVTFTTTPTGVLMLGERYYTDYADRSRWTNNSVEHVYDSILSWSLSRAYLADKPGQYDTEILEIGDAFIENAGNIIQPVIQCVETVISTYINGIKSPGHWSNGINNCYTIFTTQNGFALGRYNTTFRGIAILAASNGVCFLTTAASKNTARSNVYENVFYAIGRPGTSKGISTLNNTGFSYIHNNLIFGLSVGINVIAYTADLDVFNNNSVFDCGEGIKSVANAKGTFNNNAVAGCTTNWSAQVSTFEGGFNNAGESGNTPWGADPVITLNTTTHFVDFAAKTIAGYQPSATSPLINAGIVPYGGNPSDILGTFRPSYQATGTPAWDIGCFEYNDGSSSDGSPPLTVTITITGMASGSILAIYKASDMSEIAAPATTTGSYSASYTYTGDTAIIVRVRKGTSGGKYLPYEYSGTITSAGFSLNVSQVLDPIA
jgi:hypothetical protein